MRVPKVFFVIPSLFTVLVFADTFTITGTVDQSNINEIAVGEQFHGTLTTDGTCQICPFGMPGLGLTNLSIDAFGYVVDFASADHMNQTTFIRSSMTLEFVDSTEPALLIDPNGPGPHEFGFQENYDPALPSASGHYDIALVPEPATGLLMIAVGMRWFSMKWRGGTLRESVFRPSGKPPRSVHRLDEPAG